MLRVISADDHIQEPADTWQARVPASLRERAPRIVRNDNGDCWLLDGKIIAPISVLNRMDSEGFSFERQKAVGATFDTIRPGTFDPVERLKDMDLDGVNASVLFPNSQWLFQIADKELQAACIRAYNDFLSEFCSHDVKRLVGIGLVPLDEPEAAIDELQRIGRLKGMRGVLLAGYPQSRPLNSSVHDRFWAAAQDLGLPVHFHLGGGGDGNMPTQYSSDERAPTVVMVQMCSLSNALPLAQVIFGGVFEFVTGLTMVSVEGNVGWIGYFLEKADRNYERHRFWLNLNLPLKPSEYFRRQMYATFVEDNVGIQTRNSVGVDNLMWSSDYPHGDSTWPRSQTYIEETFRNVPETETAKIIGLNAARLYHLD